MSAMPSSDQRPRSEKGLVGPLSKRAGGFILFNIVYGLAFAAYFAQFFRFSLEQDYTPHFSLILLVSLYLLYAHRQALFAQAEYCVRGGLPFVLVGILCYGLGLGLRPALHPPDLLALTSLGMVIVWVGGFITFFGLRASRIALFPLSFLIFMIPLPEALLFRIITALQYASADTVALLFQLCPFPFTRDGVYFSLPGLSIEVARECSSIRSSMALCMACVLANHLLLQRWWSKAIVLLLVFPLAVLKNGVRIVTLCVLTLYVDEGFLEGDLHSRGGIVFFGFALAMLLPVFLGLRKVESRYADPGQDAEGATEKRNNHHGSISNQKNCS
jgi:exosortase